MRNHDDLRILRGELAYQDGSVLYASRIRRGWVPSTYSQKQRAHSNCDCPGRKRQANPANTRGFELEFSKQRRYDDVLLRRQKMRGIDGARGVATYYDACSARQVRNISR